MKYTYVPLILLVLFVLYGGCSSGGGSTDLICERQEMENRFANTDCIAEELVTGCSNILCSGADISVGNFDEKCTVVDCNTLECDDISIKSVEPV